MELVRGDLEEAHGEAAVTDLRDEIALLNSAVRRLPDPTPGEGPHLPWYTAAEQIRQQLAALERQLAALQGTASAASSSRLSRNEQRLAGESARKQVDPSSDDPAAGSETG